MQDEGTLPAHSSLRHMQPLQSWNLHHHIHELALQRQRLKRMLLSEGVPSRHSHTVGQPVRRLTTADVGWLSLVVAPLDLRNSLTIAASGGIQLGGAGV
jgi:hypothetical protein